MNTLADLRGWSPFVGLHVEYSLVERTPERDLLPMARAFGMAVTAWSPLGGGVLSGKYNRPASAGSSDATSAPAAAGATRLGAGSARLSERNLGVAAAVARVAAELGHPASPVSLNWVRQRPGAMIPLVGTRTLEQLRDNLGCLDFALAPEHVQALDAASAVERGFPHDFLASKGVRDIVYGGTYDRMRPDAWGHSGALR